MNSPLPASWPAKRRNWSRLLVNVLVALVVIAVAGATFVFSYDGVHAIALLGGVSARLARYYPGLFDAVLVIACVAAVMLRDGQWWARLWAWVVIVVLLAAIGTTDVLHAMNYTLRHRPTEGIVAAAPVRTEALPVPREDTVPGDVPPTRAEPVLARATEAPNAREVPTRGAPTREVPAAEGPADEGPADEGPADEGPADEGPADAG